MQTQHFSCFIRDSNAFIPYCLPPFSLPDIGFLKWSNKNEFGLNDELLLLEFEQLLFFQVILIRKAMLLEEEQRLLLLVKLTKQEMFSQPLKKS